MNVKMTTANCIYCMFHEQIPHEVKSGGEVKSNCLLYVQMSVFVTDHRSIALCRVIFFPSSKYTV